MLIWNLYVATHDSGIVRGRVVGPAGEPVTGAAVTLWARNFTTYVERARAVSDDGGRFMIAGNNSHDIQLAAEKAGLGRSPRVRVRLYFRAQEVRLTKPLRLAPDPEAGLWCSPMPHICLHDDTLLMSSDPAIGRRRTVPAPMRAE